MSSNAKSTISDETCMSGAATVGVGVGVEAGTGVEVAGNGVTVGLPSQAIASTTDNEATKSRLDLEKHL